MPVATAYAMPCAGAPFERVSIERRAVGDHDVLIEIAFSGICHSDIHTGRNEWGQAHFPLIPGHEITGTVAEIGTAVTRYAVGDRVGVGVLVDSCRECVHCRAGLEPYCLVGAVGTYGAVDRDGHPTDGGYSTHIVVDERFVLRIPDRLGLDVAAPLLCAGITVYSPLRHWSVGPGSKVGVIGLGGLGHVAVKIAAAMGADVTVLSQTMAKQADALSFGATAYLATTDRAILADHDGAFDLLLNTVSTALPMAEYLALLRLDGTFVTVGLPPQPLEVPAEALIDRRLSLAGSSIGGLKETQEMLDFCGLHNVAATIETIKCGQIDAAWDRVVASDVRYRFVIDAISFV